MPSPEVSSGQVGTTDIHGTLPGAWIEEEVKLGAVDPTHLDRCVEAMCTARRTNTSWQEVSHFRFLTSSMSAPFNGTGHDDICSRYAQHLPVGNGVSPPSAEVPWSGEQPSSFERLLASVTIQLNRHLEDLRVAHLEELRRACCVKTAGEVSGALAVEFPLMPDDSGQGCVPAEPPPALPQGQALTNGANNVAETSTTSSVQSQYTKGLLHPGWFGALGIEETESGALELEAKVQRMFEEMDEDGSGTVSASEFLTLLRSYGINDVTIEEIEQTFMAYTRSTLGEESVELTLEAFKDLLSNMTLDLGEILGQATAVKVRQLRASISKCNMSKMIMRAAGVQERQFYDQLAEGTSLVIIETIVGFLIVLNALTMGIAEDVSWSGWAFVDATFAIFFLLEIIVKLRFYGLKKYLCGMELMWNWADIVIAAMAMVDFIVFNLLDLGDSGNLKNLTLIRLLRLIRLTRLVKLLRLKVFKELKLMLRGVFFGMRTLCWALGLFVFFLYNMALMIRLIMAPADGSLPSENALCNPNDEFCQRSRDMIDTNYDELFSNVPRCVVTLLRCFTDGCASVDGTPLIPTLFNIYGYALLIPYIMFMFFITFGLFNLITAILVENTVEAAKCEKARGTTLRRAEQFRIASKLKTFVERTRALCAESRRSERSGGTKRASLRRSKSVVAVDKFTSWFGFGRKSEEVLEDLMDDMTEVNITADIFSDLIWDPEISEVLDDLDISAVNREGLFDVLDADGSGSISAEELIAGLVKLRGSAEKSDVVGVMLGVKALYREVRGQLTPMIRIVGALEQDTSTRVRRLEQSVAGLPPTTKDLGVSSGNFPGPGVSGGAC